MALYADAEREIEKEIETLHRDQLWEDNVKLSFFLKVWKRHSRYFHDNREVRWGRRTVVEICFKLVNLAKTQSYVNSHGCLMTCFIPFLLFFSVVYFIIPLISNAFAFLRETLDFAKVQ